MKLEHRTHLDSRIATGPLTRMIVMCAVLLLFGFTVACDKDSKTLTNEGNIALIQKQYENANTLFTQALIKDPKNFDATIGLAEVYTKKNDFAKAKEYFGKAKSLEPTKLQMQYLDQKRQELLLIEAEAAKGKDPVAFEKILDEIVAIRDRGQTAEQAYMLMGEHYMARAEELAKEKDTRLQAIAYYAKMEGIRTQRDMRKKARKQTETLRRAIFADQFSDNLAKMKPDLVKDGLLDEPGGRVRVKFTQEDKEINPKKEEDTKSYRKKLQYQATLALIQSVYKFAGLPLPKDLPAFNFQTAKVEKEAIEKGKIEIIASVSLEELEKIAYKSVIVPNRNKAAKKSPKPKKENSPEKTAPTKAADADAGSSPKTETPDANAEPKP